MNVLLDECLPRRLKRDLTGHMVKTVPEAGLSGVKNGKLLTAIEGAFDCFITIDGNMQYEQRLEGRGFAIIVLHAVTNRYLDLAPLAPAISLALANIASGDVLHLP